MSRDPHMNRHRNAVGFGGMIPMLLGLAAVVVVLGLYVMVQQRMGDTRHRIHVMRREMTDIETSLMSLRSQQDAMLTRESLRLRLQASGTPLVPIPARSVHYIQENPKESGVAMESGEAARASLAPNR